MLELALEEILTHDLSVKKSFLGVHARDELPRILKYPSCLILNTKPRLHPGEHWLAIFWNTHGHCEFFDSYGKHPNTYNLLDYIKQNSTSWEINKQRIQGTSAYCGHYCILFLLFRARNKVTKYYQKFTKNFAENDKIITKLLNDF